MEQAIKRNRWLPTSCTDQFFDFNMIDRAKSNFRKLKNIDFLKADLIDYRKID